MPREVQDHYFRLAKKEGYFSRAAYKLIELDDRKKLIRSGDRVLDCGCAPGSWVQVASKTVGPKGRVVGIDLKPVHGDFPPNVRIIEGDLTTMAPADLLGDLDRFDVILSDMAPSTTGDRTIDHHGSARLCHAVLDRCPDLLAPGGKIALKVFEGEAYPELLERAKTMFEKVRGFKPKASRGESTEIYLTAEGFSPRAAKGRGDVRRTDPRPKPRGWAS
jgi:23S rRNA (uridine2552-2'-O)-methyltransferase